MLDIQRLLHDLSSLILSTASTLSNFGRAASRLRTPNKRVVFVFSGQGSQYFGMGADLYRELPALARFVDDCDRRLVGMGFAGVSDVFRPAAADASADGPDDFEATQSALLVLELAIASLWTSWGVQPCAVIGHRSVLILFLAA